MLFRSLKPDPELLKVFLWSEDHSVCRRAFIWCLDLVPICQSGSPGDMNSTRMFIPETMGYVWVAHFIHVLCHCGTGYYDMAASWTLLISHLIPKWAMLPFSWRHDFASALLLTVVQRRGMDGLPAYQHLAASGGFMSFDKRQAFLPFLVTLLELFKSSLTWATLISLESWLAQLPESLMNPHAHTQIESNLATRKQQLLQENIGFFAELRSEERRVGKECA